MRIPTEILNRYHVNTERIENNELNVYDEFLKRTDQEIIKGLEGLIASSSLTAFFTNLRNLNTLLRETINYRAIAREELNSIE